jgi:aromatic-L-amino-acid decarboxylase
MNSVNDPANLEFTPDEMRAMADAVVDRAIAHIASLGDQPARGELCAEAECRSMREPPPDEGAALETLLDRLFDDYVPRSFNSAGPGYLAFIPGGGIFTAALADFIADTTNRYTGVWQAAPMLVQLEANVLDWFRDWMGFPPTTRGLLTTGGSMAAFNAIVCARERHLGSDIRPGVLYASNQSHHSIVKSARLAGIMSDRVRLVPVDGAFRMRIDALESAIAEDRRNRLTPFLVVSSAGTTNTGAVDPLDKIADVCAQQGLWHHIDGAYGAFFHMCDDLRPLLSGLSRGDSLTLDPHKGMFLPYGTGALLVRDGSALRAAHAARADYLPAPPGGSGEDELYDPSQYGPDLSRGFPGLRIWLSVKIYGTSKFKAALREKRALAVEAAERIGRLPGIVMVAPPQLSLLAFHLAWPGASRDDENAATRELLERVVARGRVMVTGCLVDGRFLARVCVLSFRTRREHVEMCIAYLAEESAAILRERQR